MIYTLTLNPAVDYVAFLDKLNIGSINRSKSEKFFIGGKGINVSLVLREHGIQSVTMGFIAGFTGDAIEKGLREKNIETDFVRLKEGFSRINVKLRSSEETDINGEGPFINEDDIKQLIKKLDALKSGDILVLSGSIPPSVPKDIYERIAKSLKGRGLRFVIDASGTLLTNSLKQKPFLIKPNSDELGEIFSVKIESEAQAFEYALKLQQMGAMNVIVSLAEKGAILLTESGKMYRVPAFSGEVINTVGAGDSLVAGFLAGLEKTNDFEYALRLGCASGSATAFSHGLADIEKINFLMKIRQEL